MMESKELTPEKSFEIITEIINEARSKFEETGLIYVMWGALTCLAAISQFILLKSGYHEINYYPYFIMPIGFIVTWIYYSKKRTSKKNYISMTISTTWMAIALNLMFLGFFFSTTLKVHLVPFMLILIGIGIIMSGGAIRSRLVLLSGMLINISGFVCFRLEWINHSLLMGITSLLFILVPGLILSINRRKKHV